MWPGGMREAIKSAAPVAGVSETMYQVGPKFGRPTLPYPPTDPARGANPPSVSDQFRNPHLFFSIFFRPKFDLTFDRPKNYLFRLFW